MSVPSLEDFWGRDLLELGMLAHAERMRAFPDGIVTYCLEPETATAFVNLAGPAPDFDALQHAASSEAITPICTPGVTAVEYLKFVAICRLAQPDKHIQLDADRSGMKVAQIALRFGADDFGVIGDAENRKPGKARNLAEEDIRRVIRDAGFIPKRRDAAFRWLSIR